MFPTRPLPVGFLPPCLPIKTPQPPSGDIWLHEIKLDGFRVIARKNGQRVKLYSRPGNDLTKRFPSIAEALARLRPHSCILDGEAVVVDHNGVPSFDRLRSRRRDGNVVLCAFDLIELNGQDLRPHPIEQRKAGLAKLLSRATPYIQFNEHIEEDGPIVFKHACKLGFEGIVSKRKGSPYSSGKSPHWLKSKNPASAAVTRELLEEWGALIKAPWSNDWKFMKMNPGWRSPSVCAVPNRTRNSALKNRGGQPENGRCTEPLLELRRPR